MMRVHSQRKPTISQSSSDISEVRCLLRAQRKLKDDTHHCHSLFKRYKSICCSVTGQHSSFTHQVVNSSSTLHGKEKYFLCCRLSLKWTLNLECEDVTSEKQIIIINSSLCLLHLRLFLWLWRTSYRNNLCFRKNIYNNFCCFFRDFVTLNDPFFNLHYPETLKLKTFKPTCIYKHCFLLKSNDHC